MTNSRTITVGELGDKLLSLEQEISPWAKAGMRAYSSDELLAYEASLTLIAFLETKGFINGGKLKDYWTLYAPTQHRTMKELKPFDAKGNELEVFEEVIAKILKGRGDIDDFNFIKEIEKRTSVEIFDAKSRDLTIPKTAQLKKLIEEKIKPFTNN
jgi:hypothetical protein